VKIICLQIKSNGYFIFCYVCVLVCVMTFSVFIFARTLKEDFDTLADWWWSLSTY
jgi:hypothetical protein